jgi:hypothetical protein
MKWSALNAAKYILEMFKIGSDIFDGGCVEIFLNNEKIRGKEEKLINNKKQKKNYFWENN